MYLVLRHRTYWAFHDTPPALRAALGRKRFSQNLKTRDYSQAKIKAALCEAQWRAEIERARKGSSLEAEAAFWRDRFTAAKSEPERQAVLDFLGAEIHERTIGAAIRAGIIDYADPRYEGLPIHADMQRLVEAATGKSVPFLENLDKYIAVCDAAPKSVHMKRTSVQRFGAEFATTADVTRPAVQKWVEALAATGAATATMRRALSEVRGYWKYLVTIGAAPSEPDPFDKLVVPTGRKTTRKPFTPADVVTLLGEATVRKDRELADLIALGMWTGARAGEIAALRVEHVHLDAKVPYFRIAAGKTENAARDVPIHNRLAPVLRRLVGQRKDGALLAGLAVDKHGNLSGKIGKRFGRLKTGLGYGRETVFHSIRHTVAGMLKNAGVPEATAAEIVGHGIPGLTYGLYGRGAVSLTVKAAAIAKLHYPAPPR